jgi:hypothetical protein
MYFDCPECGKRDAFDCLVSVRAKLQCSSCKKRFDREYVVGYWDAMLKMNNPKADFECHYSGVRSIKFWRAINRKRNGKRIKDPKFVLYGLGCKLQNLEGEILDELNKKSTKTKKKESLFQSYSKLCKWCMRYDCTEKGGKKKPCAVERKEDPDDETFKATIKFQKANGIIK